RHKRVDDGHLHAGSGNATIQRPRSSLFRRRIALMLPRVERSDLQSRTSTVATSAGILVAYFLAGKLGLHFSTVSPSAVPSPPLPASRWRAVCSLDLGFGRRFSTAPFWSMSQPMARSRPL